MITKKVSYLKGLAEGYGLNGEGNHLEKIVVEILDCLEDIADEIEFLNSDFERLEDYVEMVDDDLAELESYLDEDDDDFDYDDIDDWDDFDWDEEDYDDYQEIEGEED